MLWIELLKTIGLSIGAWIIFWTMVDFLCDDAAVFWDEDDNYIVEED